VILALTSTVSWADHESCFLDEGPFGVTGQRAYVGSTEEGGAGATYGTNGATVCLASPTAPGRGLSLGFVQGETSTPGAVLVFTHCNEVFEENCGEPLYSPVGAEAGTVDDTTVDGTSVYLGILSQTLGKTGAEADTQPGTGGATFIPWVDGAAVGGSTGITRSGPLTLGCFAGQSLGARVAGADHPVLEDESVGVAYGDLRTNGHAVTAEQTSLCTPAGPVWVSERKNGLEFSSSVFTPPSIDYAVPPPAFGVAVCGTTVTLWREGAEALSQPIEATAGSKSC
jgi:hypothetical protein